jgi:hypothetical protein
MTEIAAVELDLAYTEAKVGVRVFSPEPSSEFEDMWSCRFEIDDPIAVEREVNGVSSLQALVLAMKTLSACLYGSDLYKRGELGIHGRFGGSLSIPAPRVLLDIAPFPF